MSANVEVTKNTDKHQYEARVDGELAGIATYRESTGDGQDVVVMPHTKVDPSFEGKGVGSALARHALDEIREAGKKVDPVCPFIRSWIDKHPDYADLAV